MGRVVNQRMVTRFKSGSRPVRRRDSVTGEEPLEIQVGGVPLAVTMRTPGSDYELAAGFLVSEGVISRKDDFAAAQYCRGPAAQGENSYNVLDIDLGPGVEPPTTDLARNFYTTSSCGICGKASIEAVETRSAFDLAGDTTRIELDRLLEMPERLLESQAVFSRTGGIHAAALFDAATSEHLAVREDVGRHNAVDKVIGWALMEGRLPLGGCVLQVSGRASFELIQKAKMAGIPIFSAVSAPSSLAVELAVASEITLAGFVRGDSLVAYSRPDRVSTGSVAADGPETGNHERVPVR
ncbi:MAG: formate dehydrogenase accessory sulfurtransferase FdhD [Actinomycetota bacterium]|nr:formate dehydrogenase accessory sulfurtransferase FdhD [Actinomycetota bacterium]